MLNSNGLFGVTPNINSFDLLENINVGVILEHRLDKVVQNAIEGVIVSLENIEGQTTIIIELTLYLKPPRPMNTQ